MATDAASASNRSGHQMHQACLCPEGCIVGWPPAFCFLKAGLQGSKRSRLFLSMSNWAIEVPSLLVLAPGFS